MRLLVLMFSLAVLTNTAHANVPDYCAAYARDFADLGKKKNNWQQRYKNAEMSCMARFSAVEAAPSKPQQTKKPKPAVADLPKIKPAKKPVAAVKTVPPPETKAAANVIPKLEVGSDAWKKYCKNKYVSFNEAKGTYTSKTGVERKCLVTAD